MMERANENHGGKQSDQFGPVEFEVPAGYSVGDASEVQKKAQQDGRSVGMFEMTGSVTDNGNGVLKKSSCQECRGKIRRLFPAKDLCASMCEALF